MSNVEELQSVSIQELLNFFKGASALRESKTALRAVDLAVRSLAAIGRIKATERAKDGMQLTVLKSISEDKKQFQQYVTASMPHLSPDKQIAHDKS